MNKATKEAMDELREAVQQDAADLLHEIAEDVRHRRNVLGFTVTVDEILDRLDDERRQLEADQ